MKRCVWSFFADCPLFVCYMIQSLLQRSGKSVMLSGACLKKMLNMLHLFPGMGSEVRGDVMFQPGDSLLHGGQRARRRSAQRLKLSVRRAIRRVAGPPHTGGGSCL